MQIEINDSVCTHEKHRFDALMPRDDSVDLVTRVRFFQLQQGLGRVAAAFF
jgi:hypothetical protein